MFFLVTGLFYILIVSLTGVDNVSLQATSLLYVHGFIMTNLLFKTVLNFVPQIIH